MRKVLADLYPKFIDYLRNNPNIDLVQPLCTLMRDSETEVKSSALKALNQVITKFPKEIYICESMIDALTLWSVYKPSVALNGLGTQNQFKQLNELPCRKFILATDNDEAGQKARKRLKEKLKNKIITEIILPKRSKRYK